MTSLRLLFQGDSITDANRSTDIDTPNQPASLGSGYVNLITAKLLHNQPELGLTVINRGISGHRVVDLYARWKRDAINLAPDIISILIGVNDLWHEFSTQNGVEPDRFDTVYRMLIDLTQASLPNVRLVICEPFLLPCGVVTDNWHTDMDTRRALVKQLASDINATFVPFQAAFDDACERAPADYWARDGVHPTPAGHQVMAEAWLNTVGNISN
ncbi:MAG: SGNH/GDSL hydrolase family protein [Deinococcota bacterium]